MFPSSCPDFWQMHSCGFGRIHFPTLFFFFFFPFLLLPTTSSRSFVSPSPPFGSLSSPCVALQNEIRFSHCRTATFFVEARHPLLSCPTILPSRTPKRLFLVINIPNLTNTNLQSSAPWRGSRCRGGNRSLLVPSSLKIPRAKVPTERERERERDCVDSEGEVFPLLICQIKKKEASGLERFPSFRPQPTHRTGKQVSKYWLDT